MRFYYVSFAVFVVEMFAGWVMRNEGMNYCLEVVVGAAAGFVEVEVLFMAEEDEVDEGEDLL